MADLLAFAFLALIVWLGLRSLQSSRSEKV